jgi:transposase-like protein
VRCPGVSGQGSNRIFAGKDGGQVAGSKNPKRYSPEFKEEAARMVVDSSRPIAQVARELGVNDTTLGFWVKAYRQEHSGEELPLEMPDRARLRELERRNRELEMELAFLKKAAAYFAREHR